MNKRFRNDADRLLSGLNWGREDMRAVFSALEGDKPSMKRKFNACLAISLAIVLIGAVALAIGLRKSEKLTALEGARSALAEKYGLTTDMLRLYDSRAITGEGGVTTYVFSTYASEFIDKEKAGEYTVTVDGSGKAFASWSHDDANPAAYESGSLDADVWGAKQLQAALDRHEYYLQWQSATPKLTSLPIDEQIKRVGELYAAVEPLKISSVGMPQAPEAGDISEEEAISLAKAYIKDRFSRSVDGDGWDIYRSFHAETDARYYEVYIAPLNKDTEYWVRVLSPSGEVVPQGDIAGDKTSGEKEPVSGADRSSAVKAAEAALKERYGITGDMLGLFSWYVSLGEQGVADVWTAELRPVDAAGESMADWRWRHSLGERLGVYTVEVNPESGDILSADWSLTGADDGEYSESNWGSATAYDAQIIGWVLDLLQKTRPITDKYPHDQTDWFSVEDAAAYDRAFRDAGFTVTEYTYNHALPKDGDISLDQAKMIAIQAMRDAYGLTTGDIEESNLTAEYILNNGGAWVIGFYTTKGMGFVEMRASDGEIQMMNLDSSATAMG